MSRIKVTVNTPDWEVVIFERETETGAKLRMEIAEARQGENGCATLDTIDHVLITNILNAVKNYLR